MNTVMQSNGSLALLASRTEPLVTTLARRAASTGSEPGRLLLNHLGGNSGVVGSDYSLLITLALLSETTLELQNALEGQIEVNAELAQRIAKLERKKK